MGLLVGRRRRDDNPAMPSAFSLLRSRFALGLASFIAMLGLFGIPLALGQVGQPVCPNSSCEIGTAHNLYSVVTDDGLGHYKVTYNVSGTNMRGVVESACPDYAAAHSTPGPNGITAAFTICTAQASIPLESAGGPGASWSIYGTLVETRNSDGSVIRILTGYWNLATIACEPYGPQATGAKTGADGQCYCPSGMLWAPTVGADGYCVGPVDIFKTLAPQGCPAGFGNPLFPATAAKREVVKIPVTLGGTDLVFTYDNSPSLPLSGGTAIPAAGVWVGPNALGRLWSSNLHKRLVITTSPSNNVRALRGDGTVVMFRGPSYTPSINSKDRLTFYSGYPNNFRYYDNTSGAIERYEQASGVLTSITYISGATLAFTYTGGNLTTVTDNFGRTARFAYNANNLIERITDTQDLVTELTYDAAHNLSTITWPDLRVRRFIYDNPSFPGALTGVVDENGVRTSTYGWNAQGLPTSTARAGGVESYSASYASPPVVTVTEAYDPPTNTLQRTFAYQPPSGTAVTAPNASVLNLSVTGIDGGVYLTSISQPAGSGCAASSSAITYDANGNPASRDNFNGDRACYAYDSSRNLQTVAVTGIDSSANCATLIAPLATLPSGAAKRTTSWHPTWALQTRVAEPGRLTTNVYNGQPDPFNANAIASCAPSTAKLLDGSPIPTLCKQVQQATTDGDGHLGFTAALQSGVANRVNSWTYDGNGLVLTHTDPLGNVTTYAYYADVAADHAVGDLQSLTNALGRATTFTRYDKNGLLLESADPNGVVTLRSYSARKQLLSITVGGQPTTYTYDPAGRLARITQADGSYLGYEYDAAHRLTAILDNLGNRIEYTLDATGNVMTQNVKDPAGTLTRTLSRSFDALARVQQATGRD